MQQIIKNSLIFFENYSYVCQIINKRVIGFKINVGRRYY